MELPRLYFLQKTVSSAGGIQKISGMAQTQAKMGLFTSRPKNDGELEFMRAYIFFELRERCIKPLFLSGTANFMKTWLELMNFFPLLETEKTELGERN